MKRIPFFLLILALPVSAATSKIRIWNDSPTETVTGFIFPDATPFRIPPFQYIVQEKTTGGGIYAAFGFNAGGGNGEFLGVQMAGAGYETTVRAGYTEWVLGPNIGDGVKFTGRPGWWQVPTGNGGEPQTSADWSTIVGAMAVFLGLGVVIFGLGYAPAYLLRIFKTFASEN